MFAGTEKSDAQDTLAAASDTTALTLKQPKKRKSDLEGPISYDARVIENLVDRNSTILTGDAKVSYQTITLTAEKIEVNWDERIMRAEGLPDSVWQKNEDGDSVKVFALKGMPVFKDGNETLTGEVMTFNFKTRKGRVLRGRTQFEEGYYYGDALKMPGKNIFHVSDGVFTTCDKEEPHFCFKAKQMKILIDDKAIAKPIVFYVGKVPVAALPFAMFPIKRGRHSGLLIPRYGESSTEGSCIRDLGYYWAPSDYWDMKARMDFFENSGILVHGNMRYNVRYKLRGSVSGSLTRKNFEALGRKERRWDLNMNHSQDISETMSLRVNASLVSSGEFYKEVSTSREHRLQQSIRSNATLSKQFGGSRSVTVNLSQDRNLQTDDVTETLPQISFRLGRMPIIPKKESKGRIKEESQWYHSIYVSYSSQLLNKHQLTHPTDSTETETRKMGWKHDVSLSTSQTVLKWVSLNPSINYYEVWQDKQKEYLLDSETNELESQEISKWAARHTFSLSASASTKLYGLFQSRFAPNTMIRHVMTPSLSFTYTPDFSESKWNYYQQIRDTSGNILKGDRFYGSLFGSTSSSGSQSLGFRVDNVFQMKTGDGDEAKKFDLFTWYFSGNYNWKLDHYKLSDITSSLRAKPVSMINLDMTMTHSPYRLDENYQLMDELYVEQIDWRNIRDIFSSQYLRMKTFSLSASMRFKGKIRTGGDAGRTSDAVDTSEPFEEDYDDPLLNIPGDRFDVNDGLSNMEQTWDFSGTLSYSENRTTPVNVTKIVWFKPSLNFNLTKNWKISYQSQWDLVTKKPSSQDFTFYRDLHCWEAQFAWSPTGYKRFYFKINIKSALLKELKYEKGTGQRGLYGGY